jgi:putative DNA primase/helicase
MPDPEVPSFLQRASGYEMTGDTTAQALFFFHGGGANGKSMPLAVLRAMLGDYAKQAAPELLVSRGGDRHPIHGQRQHDAFVLRGSAGRQAR